MTAYTIYRNPNYNYKQVGNLPSNLYIVDYTHGPTGSIHDASVFEHTAAFKHTNWFFKGDEFAWVDSAYYVSKHIILIYKWPAFLLPENTLTLFDKAVAHLQVCSKHCMGAFERSLVVFMGTLSKQ